MIQSKQVQGSAPTPIDPNAIGFGNPGGTAITSDPNLVAAPVDQFGRPQVKDNRNNAGLGAVYRQGSWETDGDPTDQTGEGIVLYGPNALGQGPMSGPGGYARAKPRRFGLAQIITGVNGGNLFYYFRVDSDSINGMSLTDDTDTQQFFLDRMTGTLQLGNPDPTNGGKGQFFLNQTGAFSSGAPVQMSYASKAMTVRLSQYGAALAAGACGTVAFFRTRSNTIAVPPLGSVLAGDSLMNLTAIGVCGDNASIPLAAIFQAVVEAGGVFAQSVVPQFSFELAYTTLNSHRPVWVMKGSTGDFVMQPKAAAATQEGRILVRDAQASAGASANAMQGLATTGPGTVVAVANTLVTANTRITLTWQDGGVVPLGSPYVSARLPGTKFSIASTNAADVGVNVFWQLWEPAP